MSDQTQPQSTEGMRLIPRHGVSIFFLGSAPFTNMRNETSHWLAFRNTFRIFLITGPGSGGYVLWDFAPKQTIREAFLHMGANSSVLKLCDQSLQVNPVYVERTNGGPCGWYAALLTNDPRRLSGLFAQIFGYRNAVPCEQCQFRHDHLVQERGGDYRHVMVPFYECISFPALGVACGNCLFHVEGHLCTFSDQTLMSDAILAAHRASAATEGALGARMLRPERTPTVGADLCQSVDTAAYAAAQTSELAKRSGKPGKFAQVDPQVE